MAEFALSPSPLAVWVHDLDPFLVRFSENFGIRYYGLAYVLGFLACVWLLHRYYRKGISPLNPDQIGTLVTALVIGVMVGGRLGYFLLYEPGQLLDRPLVFFQIWTGGMASHGGFVGVVAAVAWFSRRERIPFRLVADPVATTVPLGLFFGRIANFINGELWGKVTDVPWGVIFPKSSPGLPVSAIPPRHPSQLYEAALEGALLFGWLQWRLWKCPNARQAPGRLAGEFLFGYAVLRSIGEVFREPDAPLLFHLSRGTFYSIFVAVAGAIMWIRSFRARPAD